MARPRRFERPTSTSGGWRSIQLSYGRLRKLDYTLFSFDLKYGVCVGCRRSDIIIVQILASVRNSLMFFSGLLVYNRRLIKLLGGLLRSDR